MFLNPFQKIPNQPGRHFSSLQNVSFLFFLDEFEIEVLKKLFPHICCGYTIPIFNIIFFVQTNRPSNGVFNEKHSSFCIGVRIT